MSDELKQKTRIVSCPECSQRMTLDEFEITVHEDGSWSADPALECPWDCGTHFFITRSMFEPIAHRL